MEIFSRATIASVSGGYVPIGRGENIHYAIAGCGDLTIQPYVIHDVLPGITATIIFRNSGTGRYSVRLDEIAILYAQDTAKKVEEVEAWSEAPLWRAVVEKSRLESVNQLRRYEGLDSLLVRDRGYASDHYFAENAQFTIEPDEFVRVKMDFNIIGRLPFSLLKIGVDNLDEGDSSRCDIKFEVVPAAIFRGKTK